MIMIAVATASATSARDQAVDPQMKLMAGRAAEADAYRKLGEIIQGMTINSTTTVRDFALESDVIESGLEAMIKGVRLGAPNCYSDGLCEVEAEVTVERVVHTLRDLHGKHYRGQVISDRDFANMQNDQSRQVIRVVGMGAPRSELPPGLPAGVVERLTPAMTMESAPMPDLWLKIPAMERLAARRAAELDARRKLLERIKGLRINSETVVRDFILEWDAIKTETDGFLAGAQEVSVYYHHAEPIVEVTVSVPTEQVFNVIRELHRRHYDGSTAATDILSVQKETRRQSFEATGSGIPKPQAIQMWQSASSGPTIPGWAMQRLRATGNCTEPDVRTAQGKLKALGCATLAARRNLLEEIKEFRVDPSTNVADFMSKHDGLEERITGVLASATEDHAEVTDRGASVTIGLPAMEIWEVLNDQLTYNQHRESGRQ
jgi:hypothetical protein